MSWMDERKFRLTGQYQKADEEKLSSSTVHRT